MKEGMRIVGPVLGTVCKVSVTVLVVLLIYRGALAGYDYGYRVFAEEPVAIGEGRTVTVAVTEGMSVKEIGQMLKQNGLIRDDQLFVLQYYLSEYSRDVKPGIYDLSTAMTVEEMLGVMASGSSETEE